MSLKDEIEKLIKAEQAKLEDRYKQWELEVKTRHEKNADFKRRQRDRFIPLRAVLEEISSLVDSKYLKSNFWDDSATIEVGEDFDSSSVSAHWCWKIEPNYSQHWGAEAGEAGEAGAGICYEEPGFAVEETFSYRYPGADKIKKTTTLPDEQAVAEYLMKRIAEQIAHYQHLESLFGTKQKKIE